MPGNEFITTVGQGFYLRNSSFRKELRVLYFGLVFEYDIEIGFIGNLYIHPYQTQIYEDSTLNFLYAVSDYLKII